MKKLTILKRIVLVILLMLMWAGSASAATAMQYYPYSGTTIMGLPAVNDLWRWDGTFGGGATLANPSAGPHLIWYPRKAAIRAGYVDGGTWNDSSIGDYSVAFGHSTKAVGTTSIAAGHYSIASGFASVAFGRASVASGYASSAFGNYSKAQPYASVALGRYNIVSGNSGAWVSTDPLFVIGNGTDTSPANALTLLKNGNLGFGGVKAPTSKIEVDGAIATAVAVKTGAYTLTINDSVVLCDSTAAAFIIALPTAVGITGREYVIKKIDSSANAVTVDGNAAETLDGAATYSLATQWKYVRIVSDGTNWVITGQN